MINISVRNVPTILKSISIYVTESSMTQLNPNRKKTTLNSQTLSFRDWWKTLKSCININQNSKIPPLIKHGAVHKDEIDKATILDEYFTEQTKLKDTNLQLPEINLTNHNIFDTLQIT